ncbi:MAG: hypothetical protein GXW91_12260 [Clostridiales bacterium]|nr:hypothetical protein [Clostridiales bacterium]
MALGVVVAPSFTNNAQAAAASEKTVYVDVEKNVIGQAPLIKPIKVELSSDELDQTILYATMRAAADNDVDVDVQGSYVSAFADTSDTQTAFKDNYKFKDKIPSICFDTKTAYNQHIVTDSNWLREKEFDGISGWMFTVDNSQTDKNGTFYTGDTKLTDIPDNAVIRWEFSAADGCDLGIAGYLPDGTVSYGYYNWNSDPTAPFFDGRVNKSDLIRAMANYVNKDDENYTAALTALQTLQATQDQVDDAIDGLSPAPTGANMAVSGL